MCPPLRPTCTRAGRCWSTLTSGRWRRCAVRGGAGGGGVGARRGCCTAGPGRPCRGLRRRRKRAASVAYARPAPAPPSHASLPAKASTRASRTFGAACTPRWPTPSLCGTTRPTPGRSTRCAPRGARPAGAGRGAPRQPLPLPCRPRAPAATSPPTAPPKPLRRNRPPCPQGTRIDYVLVSRGLLPLVKSCEIRYSLPQSWSDHVPLICDINLAPPPPAAAPCDAWTQVGRRRGHGGRGWGPRQGGGPARGSPDSLVGAAAC
jgi:hypothetical protein